MSRLSKVEEAAVFFRSVGGYGKLLTSDDVLEMAALIRQMGEALERDMSWLASYPADATMSKNGPYEQSRAALAAFKKWSNK